MKNSILCSWLFALLIVLMSPPSSFAVPYSVSGDWLTEGEGWFKVSGFADLLRVSFENEGRMYLCCVMSGDQEIIKSVDINYELSASVIDINVLDEHITYDFPEPGLIVPDDFSPSVGEPFKFPTIKHENLKIDLVIEDERHGILTMTGYSYDETYEINASNVIWRPGTERPDIPISKSGCSVGAAPLITAVILLCRRRAR